MKKIIKSLFAIILSIFCLLANNPYIHINELSFPFKITNVYAAPVGQELFTSSGTWVAPAGVTSVSVVAIGGGGAGHAYSSRSSGGGGGGLGWKNNIAVTPGQSYTVVVGTGGAAKTSSSTAQANSGGDSYFINTSTVVGYGGTGGKYNALAAGGSYVGDGGGAGGTAPATASYASGGGGAGGYSGNGGAGGTTNGGSGGNGSGGGGGGGGGSGSADASGAGGGTGVLGEGSNGTGGAGSTGNAQPGTGGSGGTNGSASPGSTALPSTGGNYGGGGGAVDVGTVGENGPGGNGAVRIIWGDGRAFPSTNTGDISVPTTILGDGTNPGNSSIGPGASVTDLDAFTFITDSGTDTINSLTGTLSPANAYNNISQVDITDNSNNIKCSVSSLSSNTLDFTSCGLAITTSASTYKLRVTPKSHANMSAPPGDSYATTGTITSWTSDGGKYQAGSDSGSATVTIDNASPNAATLISGTVGDQRIILKWRTSNSSDFNTTSGSVIYRWTGSSAGSEIPTEGSTPSAGDTNGTATVACVISSNSSTTLYSSDGLGGDIDCTTTALTNGQAYTYKVFQKDTSGNYDIGTTMGTFTPDTCHSQTSGYWNSGSTWAGSCSGEGGIPSFSDKPIITGGTTVVINEEAVASNVTINSEGHLVINEYSDLLLIGNSGTLFTNNGNFTASPESEVIIYNLSNITPTAILSGDFTGSNAFWFLGVAQFSAFTTDNANIFMGTGFDAVIFLTATDSEDYTMSVTLGGDTNAYSVGTQGKVVLDTGNNHTLTTSLIEIGAEATLNANDSTIIIQFEEESAFTNFGTFNPGGSTVYFAGAGTTVQTITGDNTFYNLTATTADNSAGKSLLFEGGSTTTVTGTFTMEGEAGKILTLGSTDETSWTITPTSTSARYLYVSNSTNTNGTIYAANSTDGGGNIGWSFGESVCSSIADGLWSSGSTWAGCSGEGGIPANDDNVIISEGTTITVDGTQTASSVAINETGTLTFADESVLTLLILINEGTFIAGESTVVFDGLYLFPNISYITGEVTFNNLQLVNMAYVILMSPITINGDLSISSSFLFDNGNQITGNSTGSLTMDAGSGLAMDSGTFFGEEENVSHFPTLFTRDHISLDPDSMVGYASESTQVISDVPIYGTIYLLGPNKTNEDDITLTGSWVIDTESGGAEFTAGEGTTVYFAGSDGSEQVITGNNTFYNLTATTTDNSTGRSILFEGGSTTTVAGTFTMEGETGKILTLGSTDETAWTITPTSNSVQYLTVSDSTNTNGTICAPYSTDGGGNTGWSFEEGACNTAPNTPTLDLPSNSATNQSINPSLKTTSTDPNSDYLHYKIILCEDSEMSVNCQTFDQTSSQTGWSGQDAESETAYASGTQAVYTLQTELSYSKVYYWQSYAIDPGGTNAWSETQTTPYSFTTGASQNTVLKYKGGLKIFGNVIVK